MSTISEQNVNFIGRKFEIARLTSICAVPESKMLIVHGRRRVGKTYLIEHFFRNTTLLKIEGLQGKDSQSQRDYALIQIREQRPNLNPKFRSNNWTEFFLDLYEVVKEGPSVLYFEETQWLADYQDDLISEFKFVWDNYLRKNTELLVIFCGSAPSFMIGQVIKSKALYNRSLYELPISPFSLHESIEFLGVRRSKLESFEAHLALGGIPEYLKYLRTDSSTYLDLCNNSFIPGAFFLNEYERVFTSSLAKNKNYRKIIEILATNKNCSRNDLLKTLKIKTGGEVTGWLEDLQQCGFLQKVTPLNLKSNSKLVLYQIADAYLQFYFRFIEPQKEAINSGFFKELTTQAIPYDQYRQWLGYRFEHFCRQNHLLIAKLLGFNGVTYQSGSFFSRASQKDEPGFQIDLLFLRKDKVITVCEIKFQDHPIDKKTVEELNQKIALLKGYFPTAQKRNIQRVLITNAETKSTAHFGIDRIITVEDLIK